MSRVIVLALMLALVVLMLRKRGPLRVVCGCVETCRCRDASKCTCEATANGPLPAS